MTDTVQHDLEDVLLFVFGGVRRLRLPRGVAPEPPPGTVLRHRRGPDGLRWYVAVPHPFLHG